MPGVQNKSIFRRFESLIDPFKDADITTPGRVLRFYAYYLLQVWPIFAVLLVVGLAGALVEVALFSFLADIVDLARDTPPAEFFQRHAGLLLWMAVVVMVLRPLAIAARPADPPDHRAQPEPRWCAGRITATCWARGWRSSTTTSPAASPTASCRPAARARFRRAVGGRAVARHPVRGQRAVPVRRGRLAAGDPAGAVVVGYCCMLGYFVPRMQARAVTASEARSSSWAASSTAIPTSARSSSSPMPGRKRTTHARRWPNRRKSSSCRPASSPRWTCPSTR